MLPILKQHLIRDVYIEDREENEELIQYFRERKITLDDLLTIYNDSDLIHKIREDTGTATDYRTIKENCHIVFGGIISKVTYSFDELQSFLEKSPYDWDPFLIKFSTIDKETQMFIAKKYIDKAHIQRIRGILEFLFMYTDISPEVEEFLNNHDPGIKEGAILEMKLGGYHGLSG